MKANEIFEIANHFYRIGFFEEKSGQFEKHIADYLKERDLLLKNGDDKSLICNHQTEPYGKCIKCGEQVYNKNYSI